ncbi:hypothetical protein ACIA5A_23520 [Micromonospora sp. NPDC051300]|uniref:hypothetical protein n=1 Tax=Micromonospora sp. NPDC051300 TaxID=3364286 RepID=UPI003795D606
MTHVLEMANFRAEMVDLSACFNNTAATTPETTGEGGLNVWRNSFPIEELPDAGEVFRPGAVPFRFPRTGPGRLDNVVCAGQRIDLRPARYDWIYLLACAERRIEDVVHLHYRDGSVDEEWLRVSDFWPASPPRFGELEAVRCERIHFPRHVQPGIGPRIWQQRLPVPRQEELVYLRLPDNIAVHIFAMTAVSNGWR